MLKLKNIFYSNKKNIKYLAKEIMLEINNYQLNKFLKEFNIILEQIKIIEKINTLNITPMDFPIDIESNFLREDDLFEVENQFDILKNAPEFNKDGFILIDRVI